MSLQQAALWGTVALYGLLALLLLSLNVFSLWRWWVKAGTMIVTAVVFIAAYAVISGLVGWPSDSALPQRFALLHTFVEEPDKQRGKDGHIYLWVQEIDDKQLPIAPPRAYVMPYLTETMKGVTQGQEMLDRGEQVLGESKKQVTETTSSSGDGGKNGADDLTAEQGGVNLSAGGQRNAFAGGGIFGFPGGETVNFAPMPPPELPQKPSR